MNIFENLLTSLKRASEVSVSIMKPRDEGVITHNLMIFLFMIQNKGEIRTREISEHFGVTSGAATGIADKLENLGLIERNRSKIDRRVVTLVLSEKGKKLVQSKKREHVELYQYILHDFSEEELLNTIRMLNKISDRIDSYNNRGDI
ncbi:MarR family transcriptional regulator [Cytobacillus oceanisediminis]|uniref:MarR family transcriptional regulator n=2 Tax=Niallia TaxID=2837506 RepID=A0A941GHF9_NIACI|nr:MULTISPECIES: MarR family transcriptional regulator [Bacillaceae]EOR22948.1 MarR family transcriptional regulator [Niallia nealsonii AAU1]MBQ6448318.1 MarR family transcriptional regulator [Bacillus sp. (in: firmicutes)]MBZ9535166.1 MarR family transcriptional regulator [Cytobacillus oceanisediminis]MCB5239035.1 MarR family transcriptional regulator [Niallia circulans]NMO77917.1 MarR family transcriptional regulator [Niallia alba]